MSPTDLRALMSRPPDWSDPDGQASFWMYGEMDAGSLWIGRWSGSSPWERHQKGDELLHQLEGEVEITVLLEEGEETVSLKAGEVFVVPKGAWHRQSTTGESIQCGMTPTPTAMSEADDPRLEG